MRISSRLMILGSLSCKFMEIIDLMMQKSDCVGQRYISLFGPVYHTSFYRCTLIAVISGLWLKESKPREIREKNVRALEIKKLEGGFSGVQLKNEMNLCNYQSFSMRKKQEKISWLI
jgi:hypothetical protein